MLGRKNHDGNAFGDVDRLLENACFTLRLARSFLNPSLSTSHPSSASSRKAAMFPLHTGWEDLQSHQDWNLDAKGRGATICSRPQTR